jgi:hypothetical protein
MNEKKREQTIPINTYEYFELFKLVRLFSIIEH